MLSFRGYGWLKNVVSRSDRKSDGVVECDQIAGERASMDSRRGIKTIAHIDK